MISTDTDRTRVWCELSECIFVFVFVIESESSLAHLVLGSLCFNGHYITRQQFRRLKDLFHHQPRSTESSILL